MQLSVICPRCKKQIRSNALICPYCGTRFEDRIKEEEKRKKEERKERHKVERLTIAFLILIGIMIASGILIWYFKGISKEKMRSEVKENNNELEVDGIYGYRGNSKGITSIIIDVKSKNGKAIDLKGYTMDFYKTRGIKPFIVNNIRFLAVVEETTSINRVEEILSGRTLGFVVKCKNGCNGIIKGKEKAQIIFYIKNKNAFPMQLISSESGVIVLKSPSGRKIYLHIATPESLNGEYIKIG